MTESEAHEEALRLNANKPFNLPFESAIMRWTQGKLSARPEFYMGRGVQTSDLNSHILELLWSGITQDVGISAADNFLLLVEELTDMSATAFLNAFHAFFEHQFNGRPYRQTNRDRVKFIGRSDDPKTWGALKQGIMHVLAGYDCGGGPDDPSTVRQSLNLKSAFLWKHGRTVKWPEHVTKAKEGSAF
jgi:hypothetical protein